MVLVLAATIWTVKAGSYQVTGRTVQLCQAWLAADGAELRNPSVTWMF